MCPSPSAFQVSSACSAPVKPSRPCCTSRSIGRERHAQKPRVSKAIRRPYVNYPSPEDDAGRSSRDNQGMRRDRLIGGEGKTFQDIGMKTETCKYSVPSSYPVESHQMNGCRTAVVFVFFRWYRIIRPPWAICPLPLLRDIVHQGASSSECIEAMAKESVLWP